MSEQRDAEREASPDAASVEKPQGAAPDEGKAFDPAMTDDDEANIPPDSAADPNASKEAQ